MKVVKVKYEESGPWFIARDSGELGSFLWGEIGNNKDDAYYLSAEEMSEEELQALPDFDGF